MLRKGMLFVVLGLALAMPVLVGTTAAAAAEPARKAVKSPAAAANKAEAEKNEKASPREASAVELELQQLREMLSEQARELEAQRAALREQQQKMAALATELREARGLREASAASPVPPGGSPVSLEAVAQSQEELGSKLGKVEKDLADTKKSLEGRIKGFGPFTFSGDVRFRYEPFLGRVTGANVPVANRHRERFRLRVNANAKFSEEFSGGFALASGDLNEPISTNQTMTNFFVRKPIAIDKAFMTYQPKWFKPLQITGGKWAYTWYRTELTWDNDLNPEGVSESLTWNWKDSFLQRLSLVAFQLNVFENNSGSNPVLTAQKDSAVFGEQVQANWKLHPRLKLGTYVGFYNYRQPNSIAAALGTPALGGNSQTNVVGPGSIFASRYAILDAILRLDVDTGIGRFPLMLLFDFVQNTRACGNLNAFAVPKPACNSKQRHGYWAEIQLGKTQEAGDMRFGYTFIRIERDAVVSAFNYSDLRQATNVANHRLEYVYQYNRNIQFGFTGLFGRSLGLVGTPPVTEKFLKRLEFDVVYKF